MYKKIFLFPFLLLLFSCFLSSAIVIKNSKKPSGELDKKPGRSIKLTEVQRITDNEDDFIFRRIRGIKIAEDSSIFVRGRNHLHQFTPEGKFIRNFIKKGEGPGEVKYFTNFSITEKSIVIGSILPVKIIKYSHQGELWKEFTIQGLSAFASLLENRNNRSYFVSGESFLDNAKTGVIPRENSLYYVDNKGFVVNMNLSFDTKDMLVKKSSKAGVMVSMDELTLLLRAFDRSSFLYISNKERYKISQIDLKIDKVIKEFSREYKSVDYIKRKYKKKEDIELYALDNRKSYNDIYKLTTYNSNLLVFTSTMNKNKEVLVDVFDNTGKYIDNFYIKIPGVNRPDDLIRKPVLFNKGFLWTTDTDEDDVPFVIKYIVDQKLSYLQ